MQTTQETPPQRRTQRKTRTGLLAAAAAVGAVVIIGTVMFVADGSDSNTTASVAPTPTTLQASAQATTPLDEGDALAMSNAFFVAYNAGDVETLVGLFTPEATYGDNFSADRTSEEQEMLFAWNAAQGVTLTSQGCDVDADGQGSVVSVVCTGATHDALSQALSAPPVAFTVTLDVAPDGISSLRFIYGHPDFNRTYLPFLEWMRVNNPDDAGKLVFGAWSTVPEAREYGELRAQYATEWASYLTDNDCTYRDGC